MGHSEQLDGCKWDKEDVRKASVSPREIYVKTCGPNREAKDSLIWSLAGHAALAAHCCVVAAYWRISAVPSGVACSTRLRSRPLGDGLTVQAAG